jgi:hypothetical protein
MENALDFTQERAHTEFSKEILVAEKTKKDVASRSAQPSVGPKKSGRVGKIENLQPVKTKDEARERGRAGGLASAEARRNRKTMSIIYAEFLIKKHEVVVGVDKSGKPVTKSIMGDELIAKVAGDVLTSGGSPAVSMMKEMREATEGSKVALTTPVVIMASPLDEKI